MPIFRMPVVLHANYCPHANRPHANSPHANSPATSRKYISVPTLYIFIYIRFCYSSRYCGLNIYYRKKHFIELGKFFFNAICLIIKRNVFFFLRFALSKIDYFILLFFPFVEPFFHCNIYLNSVECFKSRLLFS